MATNRFDFARIIRCGAIGRVIFAFSFFTAAKCFKKRYACMKSSTAARRRLATPEFFDLSKTGLNAASLPKDLGFAGFRVQFHSDWKTDIAAFLGASYFRASAATRQYGLSARGLAIDTALERAEEFPRFTEYYFERPAPNDAPHDLRFDGFAQRRGRLSIRARRRRDLGHEVDARDLSAQTDRRLGIAPLTSMYQVGENDRRMGYDWRPEIHDSDGLALYTGSGEWLWRPLINPAAMRVNSYLDENPRGFGLLQRDRNFNHYQDDGVFYERRPSLWVEPKTAGAVGQRRRATH